MITEIRNMEVGKLKLTELLEAIPFLTFEIKDSPVLQNQLGAFYPDLIVNVKSGEVEYSLVCEVKSGIQPRHARSAILELKGLQNMSQDKKLCPVLIAPYISSETATICKNAEVSYLDFAGNCRLVFDHVFIERSGAENPKKAKRELRTLFSPKASRILRCMLLEPKREWLVTELKEATGVSLGLVSNVRKALLDKEWAQVKEEGLILTKPHSILDAWKDAYEKRKASPTRYYTMFHGENLDHVIKEAFHSTGDGSQILLASFSAARWLAPFARYPYQVFYANELGEARLSDLLQLKRTGKGENIVIERPRDKHLFNEGIEAAPGIWCTGLIQTYLDLHSTGERGAEAAAHLRKHRIEPLWKAAD